MFRDSGVFTVGGYLHAKPPIAWNGQGISVRHLAQNMSNKGDPPCSYTVVLTVGSLVVSACLPVLMITLWGTEIASLLPRGDRTWFAVVDLIRLLYRLRCHGPPLFSIAFKNAWSLLPYSQYAFMSWHVSYAWYGIIVLSWSGRGFSRTVRFCRRCHPSVQCLRRLRRPDRERNNYFPSSMEVKAFTFLPPVRHDYGCVAQNLKVLAMYRPLNVLPHGCALMNCFSLLGS